MVYEISLHNLGVVAVIVALTTLLIIRYRASTEPELEKLRNPMIPTNPKTNYLGEVIHQDTKYKFKDEKFEEMKRDTRKKYHKELVIYYSSYLIFPGVFVLLSFIAVYNLDIGIPLIICAIISTILSEVIIKHWKIGVS